MAGPFVPVRPCTKPGCGVLVRKTDPTAPRCAQHAYTPRPDRAPDTRASAGKRGYDADWRRLRAWYLARNPVCEIRRKCTGAAATEVDHIVPLDEGGERLDEGNLQAACHPCHVSKTAADQRRVKRGATNDRGAGR